MGRLHLLAPLLGARQTQWRVLQGPVRAIEAVHRHLFPAMHPLGQATRKSTLSQYRARQTGVVK